MISHCGRCRVFIYRWWMRLNIRSESKEICFKIIQLLRSKDMLFKQIDGTKQARQSWNIVISYFVALIKRFVIFGALLLKQGGILGPHRMTWMTLQLIPNITAPLSTTIFVARKLPVCHKVLPLECQCVFCEGNRIVTAVL